MPRRKCSCKSQVILKISIELTSIRNGEASELKTENHQLKATVNDQESKIKALQQLLNNANTRREVQEKEHLETHRRLLNIESTLAAAASGENSLELTNAEAESSTDRVDKFTQNQKHTLSNKNGPTGKGDAMDELEQNVNALLESVKANSAKQKAEIEGSREEVSNYVISSTPKSTISGVAISPPPPTAISCSRNSMLSTAADYQPSRTPSPAKKLRTTLPRWPRWRKK